jgi:hypothetical protein
METSMQDQRLWEAILHAPVEVSADPGDLEKTVRAACRLNAREYQHVVREYQKFLYLLTITGENLRPSSVVDFIWRTHSGHPAPLPPDQIGAPVWPPKYVERSKFLSWDKDYELTLQRYSDVFGPVPSQLIWPSVRWLRGLTAIVVVSFLSVPAMVAGLVAGGHWQWLFPVGLIVLLCFLPIALVFDPWADRRDV